MKTIDRHGNWWQECLFSGTMLSNCKCVMYVLPDSEASSVWWWPWLVCFDAMIWTSLAGTEGGCVVECSPAVHRGLVPGVAVTAGRRACRTIPLGQVGREWVVLEEEGRRYGRNMTEDQTQPHSLAFDPETLCVLFRYCSHFHQWK